MLTVHSSRQIEPGGPVRDSRSPGAKSSADEIEARRRPPEVRPNVARTEYDLLKATLHEAARHGPARANRDGRPEFRAHLLGRIAWVGALNPARGERLRSRFAAIDWSEKGGTQ